MKKILSTCVFVITLHCLANTGVLKIPFRAGDQPQIDGHLNDSCWEQIPWESSFYILGTQKPPQVQTKYKIFHDGAFLYLGVELEEPLMGNLRQKKYSRGSTLVWTNDSLEINFVPDKKLLHFYKIIVDVNGTFIDMKAVDDNTNTEKYLFYQEWNSAAQIKVRRGDKHWFIEAAFPFGAMDYTETNDSEWRFNLGRNRNTVKPAELSASSPIAIISHLVPKAFRKAEIEGFKPDRFLIDLEEFKTNLTRNQEGKFEYKISTVLHNHSGSFKIFNLKAWMEEEETGRIFDKTAVLTLSKGEYKQYEVVLHPEAPGKYFLEYELYANASRPFLLKKLSKEITAEYLPLKIKLLRPCYRNNIYATMPDKTIEAELELTEYTGLPLTVTLTGADGVVEKTVFEKASNVNKVTYDGEKLAEGTYILKVSGGTKENPVVREVRIRKLPYRKDEVWFDQAGITHIDGKRFMPFGWYDTQPKEPKPWLNSILLLTPYANLQDARHDHETYAAKGQYLMAFPFQELPGKPWQPKVIFKDPDTRRKGLTAEQREKIIEYITGIRDVNGMLGYYMADEPECRDNNPLWYEEAYALISELDPYHPCIMLNWGPDGIKKYYTGCDVLLPDCYPQYFEDGSTGHPRWCSSEWAQTASALRPAWQMPLMNSWPAYSRDGKVKGVPPDYFDQRSQFFQAIIHNVKGFNMFSYPRSPWFSSLVFGPDAIGETLYRLRDYFLPTTVKDALEVTCEPAVPQFQAGLKMEDGKISLTAVNTSTKPLTVTFKLKVNVGKQLFVAGENRSVNLVGNSFTDTFAAKETHIYLNNEKDANSVPSVTGTVRQIEEHRRSRKKPGNLIALGEMKEADYLEYNDGKIPPGVPKLTASSDARYYITQKIGSLYFLVDGISDPLGVEMSWSPKTEDSSPWLDIVLPQPAPVKQVKLYTPDGNLIAGRILAGEQTCEFTDNTDNVITVALDGTVIESFKLEIIRQKDRKPWTGGISNRLLTEVEAY